MDLVVFLFGTCIGSFLNVCIDRWPKRQSVLHPRSHCLHCGKPIPFYQNIPIVTWLWLKGKTSCCGKPIPVRYVLSEIFLGFMAVWMDPFRSNQTLPYFVFFCLLWVAFFSDLETFLLPDEVTLGGIGLGILCSLWYPQMHATTSVWESLQASLQGACWGIGGLFLFASIAEWIMQKEAMGLGDVKLLGCIGAFWGAQSCLWSLFLGAFVGTIWIGILFLRSKILSNPSPVSLHQKIAFGPFLSIGAFVYTLILHNFPAYFSFSYVE
ncbi:MAG: prepilin peptidase [Opitutales bacterium]|nr:prepilin peptidase [Opitutales bacterium]